jgi:hypothetical protein
MNWLEVVGWAGSAVLMWSLLQTQILRLRALNLVGCFILIGYNGALRVWPMVGLNVVLAVINVVHLYRLLTTRHDERVYEVVRVGVEDEFLAHTLRVHGEDIARFNPGFRWDPSAPDRTAFLVARADEVVGVMVIHLTGDGTANVELDYVTRRYRDVTPGEFVYRRSGLLADLGVRRVTTPPGMVAPYYDRLGFRRDGDAYVLNV